MNEQMYKALTVDVRQVHGASVVEICGSIGAIEAETVRDALGRINAAGARLIVVDLSEVDFICSSGLAPLIDAHLACRARDSRICLAGPRLEIRRILRETRLDEVFGVHQTVDEAIEAQPPGPPEKVHGPS